MICNNKSFHRQSNVLFGHRILLGETDSYSALPPAIIGPFAVKCDECGKEYSYGPEEVLRVEARLPEGFRPHSLFRDA